MEGDLLMTGVSLPALLAMIASIVGAIFALLKWFAARLLADIEARLERIDAVAREVDRVDADLKRLMAELPVHYQRREDAIREYTVINVKLDRLYELILRSEKHD